MGIYASADLIWGVVVKSEDDPIIRESVYQENVFVRTDERPAYDPESGWDSLEGTRLKFVQVGHYEDPDPKAILTLKDSKRYTADCWDFTAINPRNDLLWEPAEKQIKKGGDEAISLGLPDLRDGEWYLIAGDGLMPTRKPLKIEALPDVRRTREDAQGNWDTLLCNVLHIEKPEVNGHKGDSLSITVWEDGTFGVDTFTGWFREPEDKPLLTFDPSDTPDVVMAITEFLGSL